MRVRRTGINPRGYRDRYDLLKGGEQRGKDLLEGGEQKGPALLLPKQPKTVEAHRGSA
jgi:hypothetical protein